MSYAMEQLRLAERQLGERKVRRAITNFELAAWNIRSVEEGEEVVEVLARVAPTLPGRPGRRLAELRAPSASAGDVSPYDLRDRDGATAAEQWVDTCVVVFAIAGGLSLLGGIVVGAAAHNVLSGLLVGTITAAVWVGLAVALLLLRQIAVGQRELVELLRAERSGR